MNRFTPENVTEFLNKIKSTETYSQLVRCLRSSDRVFLCGICTIRGNNDDYIDIETDRYIAEITTIFSNRCKCKISKEHYEDNLRRVIMIIHYRMERLGGYRLTENTHRFFNETINRESIIRMSRVASEV